MTSTDALDVDPFASASPTARIDYLFHLRRASHRFLVHHAAMMWTEEQQRNGRIPIAPPSITALPARQQPQALAADEAARFKHAHLYGLDEAATTAAVILGADMVDNTTDSADPNLHRAWTPAATPPTPTGLLRWASGIGYDSSGVPLIACHWGPVPTGTWLAWWPDHRIAARNDITDGCVTRHQAQLSLLMIGPLGHPEFATIIAARPDVEEDPDTYTPAGLQEDGPSLALVSTVLASWALLTTPGAAQLIKRQPTADQAARDRHAGLKPRPATLATQPIDTKIIGRLSSQHGRGP